MPSVDSPCSIFPHRREGAEEESLFTPKTEAQASSVFGLLNGSVDVSSQPRSVKGAEMMPMLAARLVEVLDMGKDFLNVLSTFHC